MRTPCRRYVHLDNFQSNRQLVKDFGLDFYSLVLTFQDQDSVDVVEAVLVGFSLVICIIFLPVSWIFCLMTVAEYERCVVFR